MTGVLKRNTVDRPRHDPKMLCPVCSGTGNHTVGGGRNNDKDVCTACAGTGYVSTRTGETKGTSFNPAYEPRLSGKTDVR